MKKSNSKRSDGKNMGLAIYGHSTSDFSQNMTPESKNSTLLDD